MPLYFCKMQEKHCRLFIFRTCLALARCSNLHFPGGFNAIGAPCQHPLTREEKTSEKPCRFSSFLPGRENPEKHWFHCDPCRCRRKRPIPEMQFRKRNTVVFRFSHPLRSPLVTRFHKKTVSYTAIWANRRDWNPHK